MKIYNILNTNINKKILEKFSQLFLCFDQEMMFVTVYTTPGAFCMPEPVYKNPA